MWEHHVWPVAVLVEGLVFTSGWYLLSQEQFFFGFSRFLSITGAPLGYMLFDRFARRTNSGKVIAPS